MIVMGAGGFFSFSFGYDCRLFLVSYFYVSVYISLSTSVSSVDPCFAFELLSWFPFFISFPLSYTYIQTVLVTQNIKMTT